MKRVLKTVTEDTSRVRNLNMLSNQLQRIGKYDEALTTANEALDLARKKNLKKGMAAAYHTIGLIKSNQGNYPIAMENLQASLAIRKEIKDTAGIADTYSEIGEVYSRTGDYPEAMNNVLISLRLSEKIDYKRRIARCYEQRGIILSRQKKFSDALQDQLEALSIREKLKDRQGIAASLTNVGLIYGMLDNDEDALKNHFISLNIRKESGEKKEIAVCHQNIGLIYAKQGKLSEALKNFLISLKINEDIGEKRGIAFSSINIGKTYTRLCQYDSAQQYLMKGLSVSTQIGAKNHIRDAYFGLSRLDSAMGDYKQEITHFKLYTNYQDSILNEANSQSLAIQQIKYELETKNIEIQKLEGDKQINALLLKANRDSLNIAQAKNEKIALEKEKLRLEFEKAAAQNLYNQQQIEKAKADITLQKIKADKEQEQLIKDNAIRELQLKRQKQAKNYFIAGLALFAILSFFIYRNYHTRQKLKLLTLRNKIASDLHDDVGSTLSSISIFSQMAQQQSKETIPMLETIGESSRKMLDAMADIVWTIKPENDQFVKIIMRMKSFAYELLGAKKIDFEFISDEEVEKFKLPMEVRRNLYLIFKEATNNMVKYSEARRAMFAIKGEKNNLTMIIRDDGKGFNTASSTDGNGLKNMKQRAKEIGADFIIDSQPGNGTMIQLKIAV